MLFRVNIVRKGQHEREGTVKEITAATPRAAALKIAAELGGNISRKQRGRRGMDGMFWYIFKEAEEYSVSLVASVTILNPPPIRSIYD